ncbi:MAG: AraC family transcriptional regulator, partial [Flavobacterium sp.]
MHMKADIKKYEFKEGLPIEFEIVDIEEIYKTHEEKLTSPHRTGFYHIIWYKTGVSTHMVDFAPVPIAGNEILFLNKDIVHMYQKNGYHTGKAILFTDSFFG